MTPIAAAAAREDRGAHVADPQRDARAQGADRQAARSSCSAVTPTTWTQAPDRMQAMVWCGLRRAGYEPTWEQAGDVSPDTDEVPVDPSKRRQLESLVNFCRFWRMTPRQVDELHPDEYEAMVQAAIREQREQRRART